MKEIGTFLVLFLTGLAIRYIMLLPLAVNMLEENNSYLYSMSGIII